MALSSDWSGRGSALHKHRLGLLRRPGHLVRETLGEDKLFGYGLQFETPI